MLARMNSMKSRVENRFSRSMELLPSQEDPSASHQRGSSRPQEAKSKSNEGRKS